MTEYYKKQGLRALQIWIPEGLHEAVRAKIVRDHSTAQAALTKLLMLWTGWRKDDESKPQSPTA